MASAFTAIASTTVGAGGASSITFSSIPGTYTDLLVYLSGRSTRNDSAQEVVDIGFNGAYTSLSGIRLASGGSSVFGGSATYLGTASTDTGTASMFGNCYIYIPNYAGSTYKGHSVDGNGENNGTSATIQIAAGLWSSSSAITSINMKPQSGSNWTQYSSATLYGIKNS